MSCTAPPPRPPARWPARPAGALLAAAAAAPLGLAARLVPAAEGVGTHHQLGMAPCRLLAATGRPCATCGMTTAFAHAADGNLLAAANAQPAGAVLAVLCAAAVLAGVWGLATGFDVRALGPGLLRGPTLMGLLAVVLAGWAWTAWRLSA